MLPGGQLMSRILAPRCTACPPSLDGLDEMVQRMIDEHRASGDTGDLLSMLIAATDEGQSMDDAQLRDEVMTLVLAGHDDCHDADLDLVPAQREPRSRRPAARRTCRRPGGRPPTYADLANLHVTRRSSKSPCGCSPAWIIGRAATEEVELDGWRLPAGSVVLTSQFAMHRDPRYWPRAHDYLPERWLLPDGSFSEKARPHLGAPGSFGYGKRKCIGDQFALTEAAPCAVDPRAALVAGVAPRCRGRAARRRDVASAQWRADGASPRTRRFAGGRLSVLQRGPVAVAVGHQPGGTDDPRLFDRRRRGRSPAAGRSQTRVAVEGLAHRLGEGSRRHSSGPRRSPRCPDRAAPPRTPTPRRPPHRCDGRLQSPPHHRRWRRRAVRHHRLTDRRAAPSPVAGPTPRSPAPRDCLQATLAATDAVQVVRVGHHVTDVAGAAGARR